MATIAEHLAACGAVRFGDFVLTSGARSRLYIDVKSASTDPAVLGAIGGAVAAHARTHGPFDAVAGMELGAVPLATAASLASGLPLLMIRKGERRHGTGKKLEGPDPAGLDVLLVEDVATSGGSLLEAVRALRDAGAKVRHAVVVVDREAGAAAALEALGVELHPLAAIADLLTTPQAKAALEETA